MELIETSSFTKFNWLNFSETNCRRDKIIIDQIIEGHLDFEKIKNSLLNLVTSHLLINSHIVKKGQELYWKENKSIEELEIHNGEIENKKNRFISEPFNLKDGPLYRFGLFIESESRFNLILIFHSIIVNYDTVKNYLLFISKQYHCEATKPPALHHQRKMILKRNHFLEKNKASLFKESDPFVENYLKTSSSKIDSSLKMNIDYEQASFHISSQRKKLYASAMEHNLSEYILIVSLIALSIMKLNNKSKVNIVYSETFESDHIIGPQIHASLISLQADNSTTVIQLMNSIKGQVDLLGVDSNIRPESKNRDLISEEIDTPCIELIKNSLEINTLKFNGCNTSIGGMQSTFAVGNGVLVEHEEEDDILSFKIKYNKKIYSEKRIKSNHSLFSYIFSRIDRGDSLDIKVSTLYELANREGEKNSLCLIKRNDSFLSANSIQALFEKKALEQPEKIAVAHKNENITYSMLNIRANQLARYIQSNYKVKVDSTIAICLNRSIEMIIGIVAIIKSGAAYLPIDPGYPDKRIKYILEDSKSKLVITHSDLKKRLSNLLPITTLEIDKNVYIKNNTENLATQPSPSDLVYVIYTSGSTGAPKGVMVEHKSLLNYQFNISKILLDSVDNVDFSTNLAFDLSVTTTIIMLTLGRKICIFSGSLTDIKSYVTHLIENNIHFIKSTPSYLLSIPSFLFNGYRIKQAFVGGEKFKYTQVTELKKYIDLIHDEYGPTEATVGTTICRKDNNINYNSIGLAYDNIYLYVLDRHLKQVPEGIVGELYIGGISVARGYIGNDKLTRERFIDNIFASQEDKKKGFTRLYKTGDLVKFHTDGNLEYIGRDDFQVKIGGHRIELEEIESRLTLVEGIKQACVLARENKGTNHLVAYYTTDASFKVTEQYIKSQLKEFLPDFGIPSIYLLLDKFPLTINGKVDRESLPREQATTFVQTQPSDETTNKINEICYDLLGSQISSNSKSLLSQGFNSLLLIRLSNEIYEQFQVSIDFSTLLNSCSIKQIIKMIRSASPSRKIIPTRKNAAECKKEIYLSYQQIPLWFIDQTSDRNLAYNAQFTVHFAGKLRIDVLEKVLTEMVSRHEIWRTTFHPSNKKIEVPLQKIHDPWKVQMDIEDLTELERSKAISEVEKKIKSVVNINFDLGKIPLIKWTLFKVSINENILLQTEHHFLHDGWSVAVFSNELKKLYQLFSENSQASMEELPCQYRDFVGWQRKSLGSYEIGLGVKHFKEKCAGAPQFLSLAIDFKRPSVNRYKGKRIDVSLPEKLLSKLNEYTHKNEITLYILMFSVFGLLLKVYSRQDNLLVGTSTVNRPLKNFESLMGMLVNTFAVNIKIQEDWSFLKYINEVKSSLHEARAWQNIPFYEIVKELCPGSSLSWNPLFQVMFGFHDSIISDLQWEGLKGVIQPRHNQSAKMDLNVICIPKVQKIELDPDNSCKEISSFLLTWEYNTELFLKSSIDRMIQSYIDLLELCVTNPDQTLAKTFRDLGYKEKVHKKIIYEWNDTNLPLPRNDTLISIFERRVLATPNKLALEYGESKASYKQLNQRANQLARHLKRKLNIHSGELIPLALDRSVDMIIGILAILKSGNAYVPLDPQTPIERIKYIIKDLKSKVLLTSNKWIDKLKGIGCVNILCLDYSCYKNESSENIDVNISISDLAYVIYTSGTTGKPKGVMCTHLNVISLLHNNFIHVSENDTFAFLSSPAFDASIFEIWMPLANGAKIIIPCDFEETITQANTFRTFLERNKITKLWLTTTLFNALYTKDPTIFKTIKFLIIGGEALDVDIVNSLRDGKYSPCNIINGYGPTESTTFSCVYYITNKINFRHVPIGKAINNRKIYILNSNRDPVPFGAPGELYIGGAGLSAGYLNNDKLTNDKFVINPFCTKEDIKQGFTRLYRTGDIARWLPNGNLEYLGRDDSQIKIRGYRIELQEIESLLLEIEGVKQACVVVKNSLDSRYLAAYYTTESHNSLSENYLHRILATKLPNYSLPSIFIKLREFPTTINGKLDINSLPTSSLSEENTFVAPNSKLEGNICKVWRDVLCKEKIGIKDNFFRLGGDSLLSVRLINKINSIYNCEISLSDFYRSPTVFDLVNMIMQKDTDSNPDSLDKDILVNDSALSTYKIINDGLSLKPKSVNKILLTGATGFVGSHLLIDILEQSNAQVYCLIRGANEEKACGRFKNIIKTYKLKERFIDDRVVFLYGDLAQPLLGLKTSLYETLSSDIDLIYHCAANVNHVFPYKILKSSNVLGTVEIIKLARLKKIKPIHFISTVGSASKSDHKNTLIEDFPNPDVIKSPMGYYQSKWVSERLLKELSCWDHPIYIYRLGRITGQSITGITSYEKDHFQLLTKGCIQMGYAPNFKKKVDMLPVDVATKIITKLSFTSHKKNHVFHVFNENSITWLDYISWLNSQGYPIKTIPYFDWVEKLKEINSDNALYTLAHFYQKKDNVNQQDGLTISNKITLSLLQKQKIEYPPVDNQLLSIYLEYLVKNNFLPFKHTNDVDKREIILTENKYDSNFSAKHNLLLVKGENAKVWDAYGNEYIDCVSGMGVMNIGHANPKVVKAVQSQVQRLSVCHHSYPNDKRSLFLKELASILPKGLSKIYLCNSGTEAVESALKVSIAVTKRRKIVACTGGYHGLTMGSTGLASSNFLRSPYTDILNEAEFVEYNNIRQLEEKIDDSTALFILELVQGNGGGEVATQEFVEKARDVTTKVGAKLIFDEVLTGFCRTGKWFATDHFNVKPDGILMAKAIGGGLPIGAFAMKEELASMFPKGLHSNTFGGNPLSMASGIAAIQYAKDVNLCQQAEEKGRLFQEACNKLVGEQVKEVRGLGLLNGLELFEKSKPFVEKMQKQYKILAISRDRTILFLPPLSLFDHEVKKVNNCLKSIFPN